MARTHKEVRFLPKGKQKHTETSAVKGVEEVLRILEGRWKLVILFHLFGGRVRRFSELRRAIPTVSEKMLIQQLRQMERDGVVQRFVHHQVPPKVEYSLTEWGQALCPALDALLTWVDLRGALSGHETSAPVSTRAATDLAKKIEDLRQGSSRSGSRRSVSR
jgi:DNA-binding HxlR family transcriptional regulator